MSRIDIERYVENAVRWPRVLRVMARWTDAPKFDPKHKSQGLCLGTLALGHVNAPHGADAFYDFIRIPKDDVEIYRASLVARRWTDDDGNVRFRVQLLAAYSEQGRFDRGVLGTALFADLRADIARELEDHEAALITRGVSGGRTLRGHEKNWVDMRRRVDREEMDRIARRRAERSALEAATKAAEGVE